MVTRSLTNTSARLGLGTVQFGCNYGVSNLDGKTSLPEVKRILEAALGNGIGIIDTASMYGESEEVLGACMPAGHAFRIVSKTPRLDGADASQVLEQAFMKSLERLRMSSLYGLLVHHADDLFTYQGTTIIRTMKDLQAHGLVEKIGVSVYTGEQIDAVLNLFTPNLIQLPLSLFDQRLVTSGHIDKLYRAGVEIHSRSAFLQGLLLMVPDSIPEYFQPIMPLIRRYHELLAAIGLSSVQVALGYALSVPGIDTVICGVNTLEHLRELCESAVPLSGIDFEQFACESEAYVNPARWRL